MSVIEIQNAVQSIRQLPVEERVRVYCWAQAEIDGEAQCAVFEDEMAKGKYSAIIKETDDDLREGRALSAIY